MTLTNRADGICLLPSGHFHLAGPAHGRGCGAARPFADLSAEVPRRFMPHAGLPKSAMRSDARRRGSRGSRHAPVPLAHPVSGRVTVPAYAVTKPARRGRLLGLTDPHPDEIIHNLLMAITVPAALVMLARGFVSLVRRRGTRPT